MNILFFFAIFNWYASGKLSEIHVWEICESQQAAEEKKNIIKTVHWPNSNAFYEEVSREKTFSVNLVELSRDRLSEKNILQKLNDISANQIEELVLAYITWFFVAEEKS